MTPDFFLPGEPENSDDPDEYYLINVMRQYCKDPMVKDMDELAVEIMGDRRRCSDVRLNVNQRLGRGYVEIDLQYD